MFSRPTGVWLYRTAFVAAALLCAIAAGAQTQVNVFHSPDNDGQDLRASYPPGCKPTTGLLASTGNQGRMLIEIDPLTGAGVAIGSLVDIGTAVTEIEFRADGTLFGSLGAGVSSLITIDPSTAAQSLVGQHTPGALTGLEFVGETLYGGFVVSGGGAQPSQIVTVDQTTGAITTVGFTGLSSPIGGLAFDPSSEILYGTTAGSSGGDLVTIDLASGAASVVGPVGFGDVAALEFGPGGLLFGGLGGNATLPGRLISIDPATGVGILVGASGFPVLSGLSQGLSCALLGGAGEALQLWMDGGPLASDVESILCLMGDEGGDGHEICGADILVELQGPGSFTSFEQDTNPVHQTGTLMHNPPCEEESEGCELPPGTKQIRMVVRRGANDPPQGPRRLGALIVDSGGAAVGMPTRVSVSGIAAAGANLQLRSIATGVIAETVLLPEPGAGVSLASGLIGLALLHWFRQRRFRREGEGS